LISRDEPVNKLPKISNTKKRSSDEVDESSFVDNNINNSINLPKLNPYIGVNTKVKNNF